VSPITLNSPRCPHATTTPLRAQHYTQMFKNGQKMETIIGAVPKTTLVQSIEKVGGWRGVWWAGALEGVVDAGAVLPVVCWLRSAFAAQSSSVPQLQSSRPPPAPSKMQFM